MKPIRNSAKAIIIRDQHLLAVELEPLDDGKRFFILPGGGQEKGETFEEAVTRECLEELGADIEVGPLTLVREYIGKNHEFAYRDPDVHQIEYMFTCTLTTEVNTHEIHNPDTYQIGLSWIPLREVKSTNLYPKVLREIITEDGLETDRIYLGDVN